MSRLRIAALGCADIARRRMLPAMAASPDVELVAVASRTLARAQQVAAQYGCHAVAGYQALLADADVQAVYVPLPAALHADWVEAALRAGKHVLAEKPLTTAYERTGELLGLARRNGLALMENVMFVHHPQHSEVQRLIAGGAIGEPRSMRAEFTVPRRPTDDIRHRPELGGGALWDTGVYPARAALHFLGPDLQVVAAVLASGKGDQVDTAGAALLRTAAGVTIQLSFGLDHAYRSSYEICGSTGRIVVDQAFTPPAGRRPVLRLERLAATEEIILPAADQVAATLAAFALATRAGSPATDISLRQAALLEGIRRAADSPR